LFESPCLWGRISTLNSHKEAHGEVLTLQAKVAEYKWLEDAIRRRTRELSERVKELTCLYAVSSCLTRRELTLEHISRNDLGALTVEASQVSGIPYIMDVDKEKAARILES